MQELSALRLANTRSDTVSHLALSPGNADRYDLHQRL